MYKISTFIMLFAVTSLIGFQAAESYGMEPVTSEGVRPYEISQLYGSYVKNPQGEYLGRIEDFIIEKDRISYLIVVHGGFVGMGGKLIAVPFEACSFDPKGPGFVLNVSREKMGSAPAFFRSTDLASRKWAEDSYRFFGLQPYWTEQGYKQEEQSATQDQMNPMEQKKDATKTDESKRLFYEYEPLWPII
jgi:sporulation protein YlmC with PRC-barrel domain